jgi:hypothetical protein
VPGTHAFRVWGYGTADPLEEVLAPDYFALARSMLRPGELIYVSAGAGEGGARRGAPRASDDARRRARRLVGAPGPGLRHPGRCCGRRGHAAPAARRPGAGGAGQARPRPPARQPNQAGGPAASLISALVPLPLGPRVTARSTAPGTRG